jgi:hypothetical protein
LGNFNVRLNCSTSFCEMTDLGKRYDYKTVPEIWKKIMPSEKSQKSARRTVLHLGNFPNEFQTH